MQKVPGKMKVESMISGTRHLNILMFQYFNFAKKWKAANLCGSIIYIRFKKCMAFTECCHNHKRVTSCELNSHFHPTRMSRPCLQNTHDRSDKTCFYSRDITTSMLGI